MRIPSGTTDQYVYFVAVDGTDFTTRETGFSSFTVYRSRNGAAAVAMTTPTINETDSTNMPGVYELLMDEDMTIASGNQSEEIALHITHAGMAPVTRTIEIYRPSVTAGETLTVSSGVATLPAITTDWLTASGTAADFTTEIQTGLATTDALADALWDEDLSSGHSVANSAAVILNGILTDTGTTLPDRLTGIEGATFSTSTDSLEALRDRGDAAWLTGAGGSAPTVLEIADAVWDEDLSSGHSVSNSAAVRLSDVLVDTAEIGVAGAGLSNIGEVSANVTKISGSSAAADNLELSAIQIVSGAAEATPTTTTIQTNLSETQDDVYIGRTIMFTSGAANGEASDITDYTGSTGTVLVTALANAPSASDTFIII